MAHSMQMVVTLFIKNYPDALVDKMMGAIEVFGFEKSLLVAQSNVALDNCAAATTKITTNQHTHMPSGRLFT